MVKGEQCMGREKGWGKCVIGGVRSSKGRYRGKERGEIWQICEGVRETDKR